jgi:aryl-alcohol dehydrogenase-like predicted oxidoreductase
VNVPQVDLAPGYPVSQFIKGGWQTIGRTTDAVDDLLKFVRVGVTTFETADTYAGGEELMGALRRAADEQLPADLSSTIKIHTRFTAPTRGPGPTPRDVANSVERSLTQIGVEQLDLVQLQWWNLEVPGLIEAGTVLADLQRQGKVGKVGVCNLGVADLSSLLDAGVPVATNQVHFSLIDRRAENRLASFCDAHGIGLMTFAPLAGGFLSDAWLSAPDPVGTDQRFSREFRALIDAGGGWTNLQRLLTALRAVASRHDMTIAQVAQRWVMQRGPGRAILFGASRANRIDETLRLLDVHLDDEDLAELEAGGLRRSALDVGEIERAPDSMMMRAIKEHVG